MKHQGTPTADRQTESYCHSNAKVQQKYCVQSWGLHQQQQENDGMMLGRHTSQTGKPRLPLASAIPLSLLRRAVKTDLRTRYRANNSTCIRKPCARRRGREARRGRQESQSLLGTLDCSAFGASRTSSARPVGESKHPVHRFIS